MRKVISEKGAVEKAELYLRVSMSNHFISPHQILARKDELTFASVICFCLAMTYGWGAVKGYREKRKGSLVFFFTIFLIFLVECFFKLAQICQVYKISRQLHGRKEIFQILKKGEGLFFLNKYS